MTNTTSKAVFSDEPGLIRRVSEMTEYVVVDDEEYEILVWEIDLLVGENFSLLRRRYVNTADIEENYKCKYKMVYNSDADNEADAVKDFNQWVYHKLEKVFR